MECNNCPDAEKCGRKLELAIAGVTGWKCLHEFSLENVIEHLNTLMDRRVLSDEWTDMIGRAVELLKEQPEIVRCKDCKHFGRYYGESKNGVCEKLNIIGRPEEWFCADGERKG